MRRAFRPDPVHLPAAVALHQEARGHAFPGRLSRPKVTRSPHLIRCTPDPRPLPSAPATGQTPQQCRSRVRAPPRRLGRLGAMGGGVPRQPQGPRTAPAAFQLKALAQTELRLGRMHCLSPWVFHGPPCKRSFNPFPDSLVVPELPPCLP